MRIFVGYGQWGPLFSPMIPALANKLRPYGTTSLHLWRDLGTQVVAHVNNKPLLEHELSDVAVVGYSLSASMLEWIGDRVHHTIKLGVAIDPTQQWATARWNAKLGTYTQRAPETYKKLICFWNPGAAPFGGARYIGENVELHRVNNFHLAIQGLPEVWRVTENAVRTASTD